MKRLAPSTIFQSDHLRTDLAGKSVRGGMAAMVGQGLQFALTLAGTIVLARLLTPDDFGLVGMVLVITAFADMFKNAGLSMATITSERISHEQISALFWLNFGLSTVLGLALLAGSPLVALFYGRGELTSITAVLALSFILSGLTIQHQALLYRHMCFAALAVIQILAQVITLAVTIVLAWLGWRYWALVGGSCMTVVAGGLLTFFYCPWMPGRLRNAAAALGMFKFGGQLTVGNVVRYLAENTDKLLIGKFSGANAVGLYSKAAQLLMAPMRQITAPVLNVAMPALSALRNEPERYRRYYQRLLGALTAITIPFALYCAVEAEFVVEVVLGPQWLAAIPVFRTLAIGALLVPANGTRGLVLVSLGRSWRFLCVETFNAVMCVAAFAIGMPFGIEGVATAYAVMSYVVLVPTLIYTFHQTPITLTMFLKEIALPTVLSLVAATGGHLACGALPVGATAAHLAFIPVFFGLYSGLCLCRRSLRETAGLFLKALPIGRRTGGSKKGTDRPESRLAATAVACSAQPSDIAIPVREA